MVNKQSKKFMEILKKNNGYITSNILSKHNISKMFLKKMKDQGIIEKVGTGIYMDKTQIEDPYFVLSLNLDNIIYSHMTALYFHGLSIKAPNEKYDITVTNNYFNYKIKKHNVFYVSKEVYNLGISKIKTPMGNYVKVYDIERCICDVIRSLNRMDAEYVKYSIKEYLKSPHKDLVKLSKYAEKMKIKEKVMNYVSMLI